MVQDELDKLSGLEPVSPEFNVTRNYLEWLTSLPWGQYSQEIFEIERARKVGRGGGKDGGRGRGRCRGAGGPAPIHTPCVSLGNHEACRITTLTACWTGAS